MEKKEQQASNNDCLCSFYDLITINQHGLHLNTQMYPSFTYRKDLLQYISYQAFVISNCSYLNWVHI